MTKKATEETAADAGVVKRQARYAALNLTAAKHLDDFHTFMEQEYADRGMKYVRPPSEEEEAEQQIAALLLKFPNLRERFADILQTPVGKEAVRVPTVDEHLGAEPVDDDAELPEGTTFEQVEQAAAPAADPWEGAK